MTERPLLTCRELIDFIADYLDGTLPEQSQREFNRHLAVCPSCVAYVESYRRTIAMGKAALQASDRPAEEVAPEWLVKAVRTTRRRMP